MPYLLLVAKGFQRMTAYRGATVAGVLTNFFFGLLRAYVFIAVFAATGADRIGGFSLQDALTYTALTQALIGPLYVWGWWEVAQTVRTGEIVTHLTKPYDFYGYWLARDMGRAAFQLIFRGAPILVLFPLLFDLTWPSGPVGWLAVAVSTTLAVALSFSWRFLVNVLALWFVDARGVGQAAYMSMTFLSGFMVPVAFFPGWLQGFAALTPMPAMVNTPVEVYVGLVQGWDLAAAIGLQAAWFVALTALGRFMFHRGLGHLVVQGG